MDILLDAAARNALELMDMQPSYKAAARSTDAEGEASPLLRSLRLHIAKWYNEGTEGTRTLEQLTRLVTKSAKPAASLGNGVSRE